MSTDATDGGSKILKRSTTGWEVVTGIGGKSLALDSSNNLYVITDKYEVYRRKGPEYKICPGKEIFGFLINIS